MNETQTFKIVLFRDVGFEETWLQIKIKNNYHDLLIIKNRYEMNAQEVREFIENDKAKTVQKCQ